MHIKETKNHGFLIATEMYNRTDAEPTGKSDVASGWIRCPKDLNREKKVHLWK